MYFCTLILASTMLRVYTWGYFRPMYIRRNNISVQRDWGIKDGPLLRALIRPMSRFATLVTLVNPGLGVDVESLAGNYTIVWPIVMKLDGTPSSPIGSSIDKGHLKGEALLHNLSMFWLCFELHQQRTYPEWPHVPGWGSLTYEWFRSLVLLSER